MPLVRAWAQWDIVEKIRQVVISGTGVFTPAEIIANEALVIAFICYVDNQDALHFDTRAADQCDAQEYSSQEFNFQTLGV
ncbi:MAG: hypothetical protein GKR97_10625 [Rhizobiaceae bacterium]|nr:hypothetical protein [Rhizobiaceae bacterium]